MELDELKENWEKISTAMDKQNILTSKLITQMTEQKYQSRINRIAYPELIASAICLAGAIILAFNFIKFDTPLLRFCWGLSILLLITLPALSLQSIRGLQKVDLGLSTYTDALKAFLVKRIQFQKLQKLNVILGFIFMLVSTPVLVKLVAGKDITQHILLLVIILPSSACFLYFSRWTLRHYNDVLKKTEALLEEVAS